MHLMIFVTLAMALSLVENPLVDYQWHNRLVVVFAPSPTDGLYRSQLRAVGRMGTGWEERDLLLISVFPEGGISPLGRLSEAKSQWLRDHFQIDRHDFTVVLIGKDGTEKLRQEENPMRSDHLFPLIDSMPMRRLEIQQMSENR